MATLEKAIENQIMQWLKLKGYFAIAVNGGKLKIGSRWFIATSINGFPDIMVIYKGRFIGLEVKAPEHINPKTGKKVYKGKQSDNQIEFERLCLLAGGIYKTVYSLEEVIQFFDMFDKE